MPPRTSRSGRIGPVLLAALIILPLAGFGIVRWLKAGRLVSREELTGVWILSPDPDDEATGGMKAWLEGLTNQWFALGSAGTCWYHAPTPNAAWRGQASPDELLAYGATLSPVQWIGGPPSPAAVVDNEPGRRKPRVVVPPKLTWKHQESDSRGGILALCNITIAREDQIEGGMTLEARRAGDGEPRLRLSGRSTDGSFTASFRKRDAHDIDAAGTPAPPSPDAPAGSL